MKQILVVMLLATALSTFAFGQKKTTGAKSNKAAQPAANRVREQLIKLEEEWANAFVKRDAAALERILADDYYIIDPNGSVSDKAQTIKDMTSDEFTFESIKYDNLKVRVYGAFAIVTGGEVVKMRSGEQTNTATFRFTDVFALRRGRWQAISSQLTPSSEVGMTVVTRADGTKEKTTPSGLKYIDLVEGKGANPNQGQTVTVHYTVTLENGTKVDSSVDRGQPYSFRLGVDPMIKGWEEGLRSMKVGGKRKLIVPGHLAYGARGRPPVPPNATLLFDIELLGIR